MRTTLDIDDDVMAAARELAREEGSSIGAVVSDLARRAGAGAGRAATRAAGHPIARRGAADHA